MKRYVILTVGKTHSGKSTFARLLEEKQEDIFVIDQDNHAEFINTHYKRLLPEEGPNTLKTAITQSIVEYAVKNTDSHLILCNSNLDRNSQSRVLEYYHREGFQSILVYFNLSDELLHQRIACSARSTKIFRSASTFTEVLNRQNQDSDRQNSFSSNKGEAVCLFTIGKPEDVPVVIDKIIEILKFE
ncbi:ATP-binding protein [Rossellomorea vietnamensis]|uniref:ATP-binding protein n=1 Tax=Rossellomorea vietnamensis TaxID=218284 RepID=A0A5D4KDJ9_9BACI|nr:ATP-binding protein [Rossellomorea vietnamensis]TYR74253.1 ATP-binding protein [Rossellomorea vietnamensis]